MSRPTGIDEASAEEWVSKLLKSIRILDGRLGSNRGPALDTAREISEISDTLSSQIQKTVRMCTNKQHMLVEVSGSRQGHHQAIIRTQ